MLSGAQLCQELHHGQQQAEGYGHRQWHTPPALAGDSFFPGRSKTY